MKNRSTAVAKHILVVEPNQQDQKSIAHAFRNTNLPIHFAATAYEALDYIQKKTPDLVLLEVVLPDTDGIEVCVEIKKELASVSPLVVFYTDRTEDYTQIAAFEAGADDYLLKPQNERVLVTRIHSMLQRRQHLSEHSGLQLSSIQLDRDRYLVVREAREIVLPRKAFELLSLLMHSPRKVFSRTEIYREVWGGKFSADNRTIDVHIRMLREQVGEDCIKTIKGVGYAFGLKMV
ncbi:MAG: response regulator transcription factor [Bacteroidia bacterium]